MGTASAAPVGENPYYGPRREKNRGGRRRGRAPKRASASHKAGELQQRGPEGREEEGERGREGAPRRASASARAGKQTTEGEKGVGERVPQRALQPASMLASGSREDP